MAVGSAEIRIAASEGECAIGIHPDFVVVAGEEVKLERQGNLPSVVIGERLDAGPRLTGGEVESVFAELDAIACGGRYKRDGLAIEIEGIPATDDAVTIIDHRNVAHVLTECGCRTPQYLGAGLTQNTAAMKEEFLLGAACVLTRTPAASW